jgi:hypothetical protein
MSTAHRVMDGESYYDKTKNNRKIRRWKLNDERDNILHLASHENHPSNLWTRLIKNHYLWLYDMWRYLLDEYTYRYGKHHSNERLIFALAKPPNFIKNEITALIDINHDRPGSTNFITSTFMDPPPAMNEEYILDDVVDSYRNFYVLSKSNFARWTKRDIPDWYVQGMMNLVNIDEISIEQAPIIQPNKAQVIKLHDRN